MYDEAVPAQAKSYVNELKNCEDIAMQILIGKSRASHMFRIL